METVKSELVVGIFTSMLTHGGSVCQYEVNVEEGGRKENLHGECRRKTPPASCRARRAVRVVGLGVEGSHLERRDERRRKSSREAR